MTEDRLYEIISELVSRIEERNNDSLSWIWADTSITKEEIEYCRAVAARNEEMKIPIEIGETYDAESDFYDICKNAVVTVLAPVKGEPDLYQCVFANDYKKNPDDFWLSNGEVNYSGNKMLLLYDFELRKI